MVASRSFLRKLLNYIILVVSRVFVMLYNVILSFVLLGEIFTCDQ